MGSCNDWQNPTGVSERRSDFICSLAKMIAQVTLPGFRTAIRIVEQTAPNAMRVLVLLPIPTRLQTRVGITATISSDTRTSPTFKGERFHDFCTVTATKTECP